MSRRLGIAILAALTFATMVGTLATPASAQTGSIIAQDNFNRADENPFATTGNWGRVIAGNYDGFSKLVGNAVTTGTNEGIYYWKGAGSFSGTSQFARAHVVQRDGEFGLVLLGGPDQSINVSWGPPGVNNTVYIYWYSGGLDRGVLGTGTSTLNNGDVIEAVLEDGVISAKVNGVVVKSVANTTTLTSGKPGFITYGDVNLPGIVGIFDDWEAGSPPTYQLSGTITENGSGLPGVLVTASGGFSGTATTAANGAYAITGVQGNATSILLTPTLSGHTMTPTSRTVAGPVGANVTGQDFTSAAATSALLTIVASHGSVAKNPDQPSYAFGTQVTLTPLPDSGYTFADWSGDVPAGHESDNPLTLTMNQDKTVTARFRPPDVIAFDDFNRPNETPLAVGGNWQTPFASGLVNLQSNHVLGSTGDALYSWNGGGVFDNTAQFARSKVIQANGQVGLVLLGGPGQALVTSWSAGTLYIFWYSGGAYQANLKTVPSALQNGDIIEAVLANGVITAKVNGNVVTTTPNTTTLSSGRPGFEMYLAGAIFDDWEAGTPTVAVSHSISGTITEGAGLAGVLVSASGGFTGSATTDSNGAYAIPGVPDNAQNIVLTPSLSGHTMSPPSRTVAGPVGANVTGQDFTSTPSTSASLTVIANHGTVTKNPDLPTYPLGTDVTLTAAADSGYTFAGWSGTVPPGDELDNPLTLTMNADKTVTARFRPPDVIAFDDFTRPNETPLVVGGDWQTAFSSGTANLVGNQIAGATGDALYYWQGPGTFDNTKQFARVRVTQASGQVGLVLLGGPGQALVTAWSAGTLYIYWYSSSTYRGNLTTAPYLLQNGDIIEATLANGIVTAFVNGVVVTSVANTTTLTTGRPGFETFLAGATFDDWEAGTPLDYSISGTITENAAGLAGVLVTASGGFSGSATTAANGTYSLNGVPAEASGILLTPVLAQHTMSPTTRTVAGPVLGDVTGQDFTSTAATNAVLTTIATHGTILRDPDQPSYEFGTLVTLTPVPDGTYSFSSWSGDVPPGHETDVQLEVTMNADKTIRATFLVSHVSATEDFNRPNETPLVVGGNWQMAFNNGTVNLTNNQIAGATGDALYYWNGSGTFDNSMQYARATVVNAGGQVGLILLGGPGQALITAWKDGTLYIYWYSNNTYRGNLTTAASTLHNGDVIQAELANGVVSAKINGVVIASVANTTTLTSGRPGFETFLTGGIMDNWEAGISAASPIDVFPYMTPTRHRGEAPVHR